MTIEEIIKDTGSMIVLGISVILCIIASHNDPPAYQINYSAMGPLYSTQWIDMESEEIYMSDSCAALTYIKTAGDEREH